jgi:hypothetical protein
MATVAPKRSYAENANQKVLRLLKKFNEDMVVPGSGNHIDLVLEAEGSGYLITSNAGEESRTNNLFRFSSVETLVQFLEAGPLQRLEMVRDSALDSDIPS